MISSKVWTWVSPLSASTIQDTVTEWGSGLRSAFRARLSPCRCVRSRYVDEPPIVMEVVAEPDVEGARGAAIPQVSLAWTELPAVG